MSIPKQLFDLDNDRTYIVKQSLGKGRFSDYLKIFDGNTGDEFAVKSVNKKLLGNFSTIKKLRQEVDLQKNLSHPHILKIFNHFEDCHTVYIVLELCENQSMMELIETRKTITEYECRYYLQQILNGIGYLHQHFIIHKNLNPKCILLNDKMHVKINGFHMAKRLGNMTGYKNDVLDTPYYMSPELLDRGTCSYGVDIWAVGCLTYHLIVGESPFTEPFEDTLNAIENSNFVMPDTLSYAAIDMIICAMQYLPDSRPSAEDLLDMEFMTEVAIPASLDVSCLKEPPTLHSNEFENGNFPGFAQAVGPHNHVQVLQFFPLVGMKENHFFDIEYNWSQASALLASHPQILNRDISDEYVAVERKPAFWITNGMDNSDEYGFGYELCNKSLGVQFNDTTQLISHPNRITLHYIDTNNAIISMTINSFPEFLKYKVETWKLFEQMMNESYEAAAAILGDNIEDEDVGPIDAALMPVLNSWHRSAHAVAMQLTDGTIQFNFTDHVKVLFSAQMKSITFMNHGAGSQTVDYATLMQFGIPAFLYSKIVQARHQMEEMMKAMVY